MPEKLHISTLAPMFTDALSPAGRNTSETTQRNGTTDNNSLAAITELYNAIPASVIIVDTRMHLISWNRFSRDTINGLSDQEMPDVNPLRRVHPDDLAELIRKARNIIQLDTEESAEFRMYHQNDTHYKWAMLRGKRAIIEGKPCIVAVVTEITELKQAEEQRQKLQNQLLQYQKMELTGQLAGGIAHDFNNTLTAIIGNTEMAIKKLDPTSPAVSNLSDIHKLAIRSAEMTRQLLAFARQQDALPQVVELNEAVSECLHLHRSLIGRNIRIEWNPLDEPVQVKLDPIQLDQILSNLLVNARDAISDSGQIQVGCGMCHVELNDCSGSRSKLTPGKYARLTVSDTGSGIDASVLPHIYDPFFTTKEVGKGTGLGLSTVYGIVMQNRGHIECRSESGEGTTFTVYLPLHHDACCEKEETSPNAKETIMVIDDDFILKLVQDILESRDFNVLTAKDAREGLQIADSCATNIDLVVTDVVLPTMNGIELSRLLQKKKSGHEMPVHVSPRSG